MGIGPDARGLGGKISWYRGGMAAVPVDGGEIGENVMSVNTTHLEYDAHVATWLRARDVLAGEDAVKAGGEKYLPRLDAQSEEEYAAYQARAAFFNATARTADGYLDLVFRRAPFVKMREGGGAIGQALEAFVNDADMLGTSLPATSGIPPNLGPMM